MKRGGEGDPVDQASADLLRACGAGLDNARLWEEFHARFQRRIFLYLLRSCRISRGEHREIETVLPDLAQEVYVRLVQNDGRILRAFRGDSDFSVFAFLARVSGSVVSDHFRYGQAVKRKANVIPIDEARLGTRHAGEPEFMQVETGSDDVLSLIDMERALTEENPRKNAPRDALIFKLHYIDGFTAAEIAAYPGFGLSVRGVEAVLTQMRKRLKRT